MFRRSRLSIRPNVSVTGRTAGVPQEALSSNKDSSNVNSQAETPVSVTDSKAADAPSEPTQGDSNDQHGEASCSSAIQRRKRFSVRPKVVPGRSSALPRTPKSPIKPVLPPVKSPAPVFDKAATSIEAKSTAPLQEILSPKECRLSKTDIVSPAEGSSKDIHQPVDTGKTQPCSQVKEIPPKAPVPPSIPDREIIEISEKAKTLVSKTDLTTSSEQFSLSQLLNDKSDLVRLEKARKLRQLLKEEMLKVKSKKSKARAKEHTLTLDPSKMTMRDLIHYLPTSNPMSSTLEESQQENEAVIPQSPEREASPERAQEPEVQPNILGPSQGETTAAASAVGEQEDEEEEAAEDEDALMVPQVKVAEDGTLIIDEESLTVEVQRMKGPNTIQDRDPIFERGSTTTYSSFRKGTHTKPWSTEETDMFFLAISMVGTDFTMICQLFPHRARTEIKNKFKKEERHNAWRIDKAFRERRKLDLEYFKKLLEKILEFQQSKKKLKSIAEKDKIPKKRIRKTKGKKATANLSDVEEEPEDEMSNEEQEGEKENLCNDKTSASKPKRKRKDQADLPPDFQVDKKKRKKKNVPHSEEDALPEDQCEKIETPESTKKIEAKSGKPTKALHPLGCKGRKAPKSKATVSDKEESTTEETVDRQINKNSCSSQKSTMSDNDSSDQEITVLSSGPTRSGRVSKPVQLLNYPAKEDKNSSASDTTLTSPACQKRRKRGRSAQQQSKESKKPKLITLRASQSEEDSDDEEEGPDVSHYDDENSTSAFVPASLCSPKPVVPEVEETMEELDFFTQMPDVLGMSENALCPDASCEQVQNERGTIEPCEHQLDLLVDVIDLISEHAETSGDEGYNEAAQTLLAIGNMANLSQPTESQASMSDHTSKTESSQCTEVDDALKSSLQIEEGTSVASQSTTTEVSPTRQQPASHSFDTQVIESSEESCSTQEKLSPSRKGRFSKIKPKPNLGSRTTKLRTQIVGAAIETKQVDLETATTSRPMSSEQLESTLDVFEPSQAESRPSDNTTSVMPSSHISNTNLESCGLQETVMSPKLTTTSETTTSFSLTKEERPSTIKQIKGHLSSAKEAVEAVQEKTQVYGDIATTSQLRSSERQEKSTLPVSEQSNTKSEITVSTTNEMPTTETQAIKPSDESCSSQVPTTSQSATPSAKNSSIPKKGRISKIKPKPNIGSASRTAKLPLKSGVTIEEKMQIECEIAVISEPLSAALSVSDSVAVCCRDSQQESLTFNSQGTESDLILETSRSPEQTESGSQSTLETHLEHLQVKCDTPYVQCEEKSQDQLKPVKNFKTIESGNMDSTQIDHSSEEEKTANTRPVQPSHSSLESSKPGTPQRRRWIPKVKPKLILSPRTTKSKLETDEKSHVTEKLVKSSSVAATSEQQAPPENTSTIPHEYKAANVDPSSTTSVPSNLDISIDTVDTQQPSYDLNTNTTNIQSSSVSELNARSTEKTEKNIYQDPTIVGQPEESCATNQTNIERCRLMECEPFDSGKPAHQLQDTTLKNTDTCQESRASSNIQYNKAVNVSPSGSDKVQDSSVQNTFECQNLFPNLLPDQVPSDPDEQFFILSLTEIPVGPSGEVVDFGSCLPATVIEAQQRHPVEPVVPATAGIDISLSNIHIPTPEKAALGSGLICVEEYLPSAPSVDISILTEPQEIPSVRRLTLPEVQDSGTVDDKTNSRRQNLFCKATAEETNKLTNTTQDHAKTSAHVESRREMTKSQEESCGSSVTGKRKSAETRNNKPQNGKTKATYEPLLEQKEMQSSCVPTSEIMTCSSRSNKNLSTCVSSEPLDFHQSDTANLKEGPTHSSNTSSKLPCGQNNSLTQEQPTEASSNISSSLQENLTAASSLVRTIHSSQHDDKKTNVKGNANKKSKALKEAKGDSSRLQRKCAAVNLPEALLKDDSKESSSSSSTVPGPTHESCQQSSLRSTSSSLVSHHSDSIESSLLKEEPIGVSQYFISDVFTEVVSDDCSVIRKSSDNTTCTGKSQTAEMTRNKRQNRQVKASNDSSSGQAGSMIEKQHPEVCVIKEKTSLSSSVKTPSTSSVTETSSSEPSQKEAKKTTGKGCANKKKQASCKSLKSQRQSKEALKSPEVVSLDTSKETQSTSSMAHPQDQRRDQFPLSKKDSTESNKELSHVSRGLAGDAFTEVESGNCAVTEKEEKTRQQRKTKSSSSLPCSQRNPLTEEKPPEMSVANQTQKNVKSADLNQSDTEKPRGKERSNRNNKSSTGAEARGSQSQRRCTEALKSPETLPAERMKENPPARAAMDQPQLPALQSDPKESSDEEPTNVSQYFLSDVFTEVDEEFKS